MKSTTLSKSRLSRRAAGCGGLLLLALAACNAKSAEKCEQGLKAVRQALQADDFELANKWRQYAYAECEAGAQLGSLDNDIVARQSLSQKKASVKKQEAAENLQLLTLFKQFIATHKASINLASSAILCEEAVAPALADERWCSATRAIGGKYTLQFRYWDKAREAVQFAITPLGPIACADLGPHTVVASWQVPAVDGRSVARTHCAFNGGELAGLDALVNGATNAPVTVFSKEYLERDERLKVMTTPK